MKHNYIHDLQMVLFHKFPDHERVPISQSNRCSFCHKTMTPDEKGVVCSRCIRGFEDNSPPDRRAVDRDS